MFEKQKLENPRWLKMVYCNGKAAMISIIFTKIENYINFILLTVKMHCKSFLNFESVYRINKKNFRKIKM